MIILCPILFVILPLLLANGLWIIQKSSEVLIVNQDHRLKQFCGDSEYLYTTAKHNASLLHSGIIGLTGGSIFGQLFEMKFINLNLSYSLWAQTSIAVTAIRVAISLALYVVCALPFFFVSIEVPESDLYYLWGVKFFLPCFSMAFLLFAFGRLLFFKLNLVND